MNKQLMADLRAADSDLEITNAAEAAPKVDAQIDALSQKMDRMLHLMEEQVHLQRVALLEEGHILRFHAEDGQRIALSLPEAQSDDLQRTILRQRSFCEARLLAAVQAEGLVGCDSTVLDVGANIGHHTVHFARVMGAGRVIAFEPLAHRHATLHRNVALNGLEARVVTRNVMAGAESGAGRLASFEPHGIGAAGLAPDAGGDVCMVALDDAVAADDLQRLDLIRIAVGGMQLEVLEGAEVLLRASCPALWIEILPGDPTAADTFAFLEALGYRQKKLSGNDYLFRAD